MTTGIAGLLLTACGGGAGGATGPATAPAVPRAVDTSGLGGLAVVQAVLDECHAPLRGQMARVTARVTLPDGSHVDVFADLPDRLRAQGTIGQFVVRGDDVKRLDTGAAANPEETARLQRLRWLVDAAALGPLHRATGCERTGADSFAATTAAGPSPVAFTLRPGTLLPSAFVQPAGRVTIVEWRRTTATWLADQLEIDGLGRCRVQFTQGALGWTDDVFDAPGAARTAESSAPRTRVPTPGAVVEPRSPTPVVVPDGKAQTWVCVPDPGDWPQRAAAYRPLHAELERQNQHVFGFPLLWQEDGKRWLAAPFRQRAGGPAFRAPAGWVLREIPAARWLVVYPADGDVAQKVAHGERALADALVAQRLTAAGPVLAQPFFHLQEGEPPAAKLAAPTVRVVVRLR